MPHQGMARKSARRPGNGLAVQPTARIFARRRLYDTRSALTMIAQGVTEFATVNVKDFEGTGFRRVWSPLGE